MADVYYFDKNVKKGSLAGLPKLKKKPIWIDITKITREEAELIKKEFNIHPLTTEDLINQKTRIKVEEFPNYIFCVFYGIKKNKEIESTEINFILGRNFIISNHSESRPLFNELKENKERLQWLFSQGVEFIFHKLLDSEIDNFFPILEHIDDQIERIEEEVVKKTSVRLLHNILEIKRLIISIKKITLPQREKISYLTKKDYAFISEKAAPYFRDIYDHAIRVADTIDNYRESAGNTLDVYMSTLSNNMNEVMKVLSIIATIALPLTVISGIYGTNFQVLPGSSFTYGFWGMILFMALISLFMLYIFRKRNWF